MGTSVEDLSNDVVIVELSFSGEPFLACRLVANSLAGVSVFEPSFSDDGITGGCACEGSAAGLVDAKTLTSDVDFMPSFPDKCTANDCVFEGSATEGCGDAAGIVDTKAPPSDVDFKLSVSDEGFVDGCVLEGSAAEDCGDAAGLDPKAPLSDVDFKPCFSNEGIADDCVLEGSAAGGCGDVAELVERKTLRAATLIDVDRFCSVKYVVARTLDDSLDSVDNQVCALETVVVEFALPAPSFQVTPPSTPFEV